MCSSLTPGCLCRKKQAVGVEDYDAAKSLKTQIDSPCGSKLQTAPPRPGVSHGLTGCLTCIPLHAHVSRERMAWTACSMAEGLEAVPQSSQTHGVYNMLHDML